MAKIKICGLTRKEDIVAVNTALPDFIGFVFAKSQRQITVEKAKILKGGLHPLIKTVGVFVNEEIERIIDLCHTQTIDLIQLHGDEKAGYAKALKSCLPNEIIKAIRVKGPDDVKKAEAFPCDYFLFDAYSRRGYGGLGKTFDWSMLSSFEQPYFLAGGISIANVTKALAERKPYGIDISSGAETAGYKDPQKIRELVAMVRKHDVEKDFYPGQNMLYKEVRNE